MEFTVYEYEIKDDNNIVIIGSFTLKENPNHPEIVEQLNAHPVDKFEI